MQVREEGVVWQDVDGAVLILDTRSSKYLSLTGSARLLWPRLVEGSTRDDLVRVLTGTYPVDEATAARDVDVFVADLQQRGLLLE